MKKPAFPFRGAARIVPFAASLLVFASCATSPMKAGTPNSGHLVIIGGALKKDNEAIYTRIVELSGPGGTIGVVPTASGLPDAGFSYIDRFKNYGGTAELINVRETNSEAANTPEIAAQIRSMTGIFFTGGDQARIRNAFRPEGGDALGYPALLDVLKNGGVISGSSAGAAMMSDPLIGGGSSENALVHGVTARGVKPSGVLVEPGMNFFPYGLTGQHFMARGRLGRSIVALEHIGIPRSYGVDENSAIDVDLSTGMIETVGNERALLLTDIGEMKREGKSRLGIRISMLGGGDRVDGNDGTVTVEESKIELVPTDNSKTVSSPDKIWGKYVFSDLIEELALSPQTTAVGTDANFEVRLTEDDRTRVYIGPNEDPKTISVVNLRLDIVPRKSME